jgi:hypothetical protein
MRKLLVAAAAGAALLGVAGAANASVNVQIWTDVVGAASDATLGQAAGLGSPNAVIDLPSIDFNDAPFNSDDSTVGYFLHNPVGLNATVGSHLLDNTYLYITGDMFLAAGDNNFVVTHDDGLQLFIDGIGLVVDKPDPTSPTPTSFTANAPTAGNYHFELSYGECCGGPAQLELDLNNAPVTGTPEPATWAMMLLGFGGLGSVLRRRKAVLA